jgi:hypothetical protein
MTPLARPTWSYNTSTAVGTGTAIGTGLANTNAMAAQDPTGVSNTAGKECRAFTGGGYSDWFLPSRDECQAMNPYRTAILGGNFQIWSSSETTTPSTNAWLCGLGSTFQTYDVGKTDINYAVPIRAFG